MSDDTKADRKGPVTNPRRQVEFVDQQCQEATPLIVARHDDIPI